MLPRDQKLLLPVNHAHFRSARGILHGSTIRLSGFPSMLLYILRVFIWRTFVWINNVCFIQHIWCYVPCIRCLKINCSVVRDVITIILQALYVAFLPHLHRYTLCLYSCRFDCFLFGHKVRSVDRDVRSLPVTHQGPLPTDLRPPARGRSFNCLKLHDPEWP